MRPERGRSFCRDDATIRHWAILNIRFTLPNAHRPISTTVAVRNLRGGTGLGVQFLDLSAEDRLSVRDFLAREAEVAEEFLNKMTTRDDVLGFGNYRKRQESGQR